ncbi:hypothetical protein JB92DRAFT_2104749 [Gautieria morchelliformis]|nr:hypothetical protein JB92DRAFT_2104749 [Gautieria morchelliformis]
MRLVIAQVQVWHHALLMTCMMIQQGSVILWHLAPLADGFWGHADCFRRRR